MRGSFEWNATLSAVSRLFVYGSTSVALLRLRRIAPDGARFRLPAGPLFAAFGIGFCGLLLTRMGQSELVLLGTVALVALVHWTLVRQASPTSGNDRTA